MPIAPRVPSGKIANGPAGGDLPRVLDDHLLQRPGPGAPVDGDHADPVEGTSPKNGIDSNSRLSTMAGSRNRHARAIVSHAD